MAAIAKYKVNEFFMGLLAKNKHALNEIELPHCESRSLYQMGTNSSLDHLGFMENIP